MAEAIAQKWADANPERVAELVVMAILESPEAESVPPLIRVQLKGILEARVADELGNGITVSLTEVAYYGDALFSVTFLVTGTVVVDLGPVDTIEIAVPIILTVNVESQQIEDSQVDMAGVKITIN